MGILDNGGVALPQVGTSGHLDSSLGLPYYSGPNQISQIPGFQRDYNLGRASITKIREGRAQMMRILFEKLKGGPGWVVDDVRPNWYEDHAPLGRIYLAAKTNQGGTTGSGVTTGTFTLEKNEDTKLLQKNDIIAIMCSEVALDRNANATVSDYASASGGSDFFKITSVAKPSPELCKVISTNNSTGKIVVERNVGGNSGQAALTGTGFTVLANVAAGATKTDPGTNKVYAADAFIVKVGNSIAETNDDQTVWALKMTGNYNNVQRVMRKWASNDMEEKVLKRGLGKGNTFQKNAKDANESFWDEMEWLSILGYRGEETDENGNYVGHAGGLMETIPPNNIQVIYEPNYEDYKNKPGDFNIPYFNYLLESKGYYGGQEKFLIGGAKFNTAFSMMINYMTQNVPTIKTSWGVYGKRFESSNGLILNVINSDKMTLNGFGDRAILWDPSTLDYGYLGEDVKIISPLPSTNPHIKTGEIFVDVTFKRTNLNANHMFILQPNNQS